MLQQRAAGEAPLHEPPHVSLLILLAAAQARTRMRQERPVQALVLTAMQVREMHAARASYDGRLPNHIYILLLIYSCFTFIYIFKYIK